jgi:hypothetical protein
MMNFPLNLRSGLIVSMCIILPFPACDPSKGTLNQTGFSVNGPAGSSPFNGNNYPDPHPHSDSDDAQRAAYQQHQDEQRNTSPSEPDLSKMPCTGSKTVTSGSNSGVMTSSQNCHN